MTSKNNQIKFLRRRINVMSKVTIYLKLKHIHDVNTLVSTYELI